MTEIKPRAGLKEWLGLVVIVLVTLLIAIDISVLGFAITPISESLKPSATQLLWIMDIYSFVLAGALITMGWVGDRFGRRKLLIIGALVFGVASALAATADSPEMLIASRALLGLGAATLTPTSLALIRNMFHDSKQRKSAIAAWSGTLATGAALGPVVGGLLLNNFWWGSVFMINTPVMVLVLILAPILLPERRDPRAASWTSSVRSCRSRASCRSSTASRSWPSTAGPSSPPSGPASAPSCSSPSCSASA